MARPVRASEALCHAGPKAKRRERHPQLNAEVVGLLRPTATTALAIRGTAWADIDVDSRVDCEFVSLAPTGPLESTKIIAGGGERTAAVLGLIRWRPTCPPVRQPPNTCPLGVSSRDPAPSRSPISTHLGNGTEGTWAVADWR
jgi:hypothetical protein